MPYSATISACLCALLLLCGPHSAVAAPAGWAAAWEAYAAETARQGLQPACQPRRYRPPPGAAVKGVAIALHGFSACPQQFFQLGPLLASQGFEVLVPVLPGHGLRRRADGADELDQVPDTESWATGYGGLAERMNKIAGLAPAPRVLIGYSLGGAIAINSALRAPDLYARLLLVAPLIEIWGGTGVELAADLLGRTPVLRDWGPKTSQQEAACAAWTAAGRGGFCNYRLEHVAALVQLANQNRDWKQRRPLNLPVQAILADGDVVISNTAIKALAKTQENHGPIKLCLLTGDVPHEIFTPFENAGREMVWLPRFLSVASNFVVRGELQACGLPAAAPP